MKIMVIEDVDLMKRLIIKHLNNMGFTDLVDASNGREALEKLRFTKVDFIITDWIMPNISGIELTKFLRSNKAYEKIPILIISSNDEKEDVQKALRAGVNDYIVKPFTAEVLKNKIESILKKISPQKVVELSKP